MNYEDTRELVGTIRNQERRIADLEVQEFFDPLSGARYTILGIIPELSDGAGIVVRWMPGVHIKGVVQSWTLLDDGGLAGNATVLCKKTTFGAYSGAYVLLGTMSISSSVKGYGESVGWILRHGDILRFEISGTPTVSGPITVALEVLLAGA